MTGLKPEEIRRLISGGYSAEEIAKYAEQKRAATAAKRAKDAERQRRKRERDSRGVTRSHAPPDGSPLSNPLPSTPPLAAAAVCAPDLEISDQARVLAAELARFSGHDPANLPPLWVAGDPAVRVQEWLNDGWSGAMMREVAKAKMQHRRGPPPRVVTYFRDIFAEAHAQQNLRFPPHVVASNKEASHGRSPKPGNVAAVTRRLAEEYRAAEQLERDETLPKVDRG